MTRCCPYCAPVITVARKARCMHSGRRAWRLLPEPKGDCGAGREGTCGWRPRRRVCFAGEMPPTMGATQTPSGFATLCRCSHTCRPITSSTSGAFPQSSLKAKPLQLCISWAPEATRVLPI